MGSPVISVRARSADVLFKSPFMMDPIARGFGWCGWNLVVLRAIIRGRDRNAFMGFAGVFSYTNLRLTLSEEESLRLYLCMRLEMAVDTRNV